MPHLASIYEQVEQMRNPDEMIVADPGQEFRRLPCPDDLRTAAYQMASAAIANTLPHRT
nr:hypothetical protein [uncultured Rhodopila sp.]